jgi:hypothetical protein
MVVVASNQELRPLSTFDDCGLNGMDRAEEYAQGACQQAR